MSNGAGVTRIFKDHYKGIIFWIDQIVSLAGTLSGKKKEAQNWGSSVQSKFGLSDVQTAFGTLRTEDNARNLDKHLQEIYQQLCEKGGIHFRVSSLDNAEAIADFLNLNLQRSIGHHGLISPRRNQLYRVATSGLNADGYHYLA
ncbi:hypothetical protein JCM3765_007596 [Sporobolomyces pararoseus]